MSKMNASGNDQNEHMTLDPFDLRLYASFPLAFDGEGDDGADDGDDDGGSGDGSDKDDKGGSSSGGQSKEKDGDDGNDDADDKQTKSREAAKYRTERNAERQKRQEAEAALEKLQRKERSDLENAEKDRDTFKAKAETLESEIVSLKVRVALFESGALNVFLDPSDAGRYLDFNDFVDKDGEVKAKDLKDEIERLKKEKGYLFSKEDEGDGSGDDRLPSGSKPKGKKQSNDDATREALAAKFPALSRR